MIFLKETFKILYWLGLSPLEPNNYPYSFLKWFVIGCIFHNIIPQITYLKIHIHEVFNVAATLAEVVFSTRTFLMVNILILDSKLLRTLITELLEFIELKLKHDPKKHFARAAKCLKRFPRSYFGLGWTILVLNGVIPAFYQCYQFSTGTATEATYVLPLNTHYFFDTSKSVVYQISYVNTMISKFVAVTAAVSIDVLFSGLCVYLEALYRCLVEDLVEMDELYAESSEVLPKTEKVFAEKIKIIIFQHCQIIQFISMIDSIFKPIILLQFVTSIVMIAVIFFESTVTPTYSFKFAMYAGFFLATVFQLWLYCAAGNLITTSSEEFFAKLYDSHWYNYPMWARKYLILMLIMAGKDRKLRIGNSFACDMETFSKVLQSAHSFFSLLQNLP